MVRRCADARLYQTAAEKRLSERGGGARLASSTSQPPHKAWRVLARVLPRFAAICNVGVLKCREVKGLTKTNPLPSTTGTGSRSRTSEISARAGYGQGCRARANASAARTRSGCHDLRYEAVLRSAPSVWSPPGARDYQGGEDRRGREGAEALRALGVERIVVTPL